MIMIFHVPSLASGQGLCDIDRAESGVRLPDSRFLFTTPCGIRVK